MKIQSWNVNGIRAVAKKGFTDIVKSENPDILCLQETKSTVEQAKEAVFGDLTDYTIFGNESKARKGYSGTAIFTKEVPKSVTYDMGIDEHDQEGRVITAEFEQFYLVTVYTPNSGSGLKRIDYRTQWDKDFLNHCLQLEKNKPVIICGDLNVAHRDIDLKNPKSNYNKSAGYTQKEIDGLDALLNNGFTDSFRDLHPEEVKYSWWSYRFGAREKNIGWRIDYFLVSNQIKSKVESSSIHNDIQGSDHCPVSIVVNV